MVQQPSTRVTPIVVRRPRDGDAVGHALRGAFVETAIPDEMAALLRDLDRPDCNSLH